MVASNSMRVYIAISVLFNGDILNRLLAACERSSPLSTKYAQFYLEDIQLVCLFDLQNSFNRGWPILLFVPQFGLSERYIPVGTL